jgi:hypothetical protein
LRVKSGELELSRFEVSALTPVNGIVEKRRQIARLTARDLLKTELSDLGFKNIPLVLLM